MTSVLLGNMFAFPLHIASWQRPAGSKDYRVTNSYDGQDILNGGKHRATDVGNFLEGHAVKSPVACAAMGLKHTDGALGVRFNLGSGTTIELWHLDSVSIPTGRWTSVGPAQSCGTTGNTGARLPSGAEMPKHTHIAAARNSVPFDVEPYLPMVERAAKPLPLTLEDDPMDFGGAELDAVDGVPAFRLDADSHFRKTPDRTAGNSYQVFPKGTSFAAAYTVDGEALGGNDQWYETRLYVNGKYRLGYIHTSVATRQNAPAGADCSAQEATIAQLQTKIDRARTANEGAQTAQDAVEAALA